MRACRLISALLLAATSQADNFTLFYVKDEIGYRPLTISRLSNFDALAVYDTTLAPPITVTVQNGLTTLDFSEGKKHFGFVKEFAAFKTDLVPFNVVTDKSSKVLNIHPHICSEKRGNGRKLILTDDLTGLYFRCKRTDLYLMDMDTKEFFNKYYVKQKFWD